MRFILVSLLLSVGCCAFGQHPADSDTTGMAAAKKQLEKSRKQRQQFEAILTHFDGDRDAARDSLNKFRIAALEQEAVNRVESYKSNTQLDTLKEIDLSHGRLTAIPSFVFQATSLERLILDHNDLHKLSGKLKKLKALKQLDWSYISADHKKAKIPKIKSLEHLDLSENSFQKIANLKKLKSLKTLDLSTNAFTAIPVKSLLGNRKLEDLYLNKNTEIQIGPGNYEAIPNLKVLKLASCDLTSIDESLYGMTSLTELQLPENKLQSIPGGISNLGRLKTLSFYKNELTNL
ncbi:MAG: leucine-rich repeat domain-containing protein, partial [Cytophagales bacterium]|nr:leucine-rich repeat domain-containing protein [Cytophagales bacterium]